MFPIADVQRALERDCGRQGARHHILAALRSGSIVAECERFVGRNASAYSMGSYPDEGAAFALPAGFWWRAEFMLDGENRCATSSALPGDNWFVQVNWVEGRFFVSGTRCRGTLPVSRRAYGVRLAPDHARALLSLVNVPMQQLLENGRATDEQVSAWCVAWLKAGPHSGERKGFDDFRNVPEFADLSRDDVFRPAFKRAKAITHPAQPRGICAA